LKLVNNWYLSIRTRSGKGLENGEEIVILSVFWRWSSDEIKLFIQKGITIMLFSLKEKGQGLVEYAIILVLIAIVVIAIMGVLGGKIKNTFSSIGNSLTL
jgi:pilus assembly protein Flp/PilA